MVSGSLLLFGYFQNEVKGRMVQLEKDRHIDWIFIL